MLIKKEIDQLDSMYPTVSWMLDPNEEFTIPEEYKWCSIFGYSYGQGSATTRRGTVDLSPGQYFSVFVDGSCQPKFRADDKVFLVCCLGFKCQDSFGWAEEQGRLSYIDGCTDSLLIYPPRCGDPSMNLLHFPPGIDQTRHLHPSIRIGCVIKGQGYSDVWEDGEIKTHELRAGDHFCLNENELHRFRTDAKNSMTVIAWHPDGDWGPTDQNHTMLNRTYIR